MIKSYRAEAEKLNKNQIGQQQLILVEGVSSCKINKYFKNKCTLNCYLMLFKNFFCRLARDQKMIYKVEMMAILK